MRLTDVAIDVAGEPFNFSVEMPREQTSIQ